MSRIENSKLVGYQLTGKAGAVTASKVVAYLLLAPGESGPDTSNRQGHVFTQIIRRG